MRAAAAEPFGRHVPDHLVRLLTVLKTGVLQALGCGKQGGVEFRHA